MDKKPVDPREVTRRCAWCGKRIGKHQEVFAIGAKAQPGAVRKDQEGTAISVFFVSAARTVYAIVSTSDSQAKKKGDDLLFAICSEACAEELKKTLKDEMEMGKSLLGEIGDENVKE